MAVELLTESIPEVVETIGRLIPQLSRSVKPLDAQACERFISQPDVHFPTYRPGTASTRGEHPILDMLSLTIFGTPTGVRAQIKGIVVDEAARGQGVGLRPVEATFEQAKKIGARTINLMSRPSREATNRLYRRAGFEQCETNVYRMPLG